MRVLLTGGTGFVGAHTVAALLAAGHQPRLLVRSPDKLTRTVAALGVDTGPLEVVVGDMTDPCAVNRAVEGCEAAIHSAAMVTPLDGGDPRRILDANVGGARTVVDAALDAGCDPVVHVSSIAAVFTPSAPVLHADLPPAVRTVNPYTRSKALAEELVRQRQAAGRPVTVVYPGGVCGPAAGDALGDVAEGFVSMLKSGFVALHDGGVNVLDVRDLAQILVAALAPGAGPRRFMAGGQLVTLPQIGEILRRLTGRRMPVLPAPGAMFRALGRGVDSLRKVVPFQTVFTAEAMQALTLARPTDDRAVHEQLGVTYRDPVESIDAMVRSLHDAGRLTARQVGAVASRATA